ncbi:hypothetical protein ACH5RR_027405 [Cinchona calisaya]|uniref:beta-galactosidase n=1 Tax=Cinchona calisaya TaxID=153742 RepID=A0ABD2Z6C3_9GENT
MWEDLIIKAKNAGLDAIDTYVFWNIHEPTQGNVCKPAGQPGFVGEVRICGPLKEGTLQWRGPIILSQIENEYETAEKKLGAAGSVYLKWATATAVGLNTGVPWVMCKQDDAPDPINHTCNGFYSNTFLPNKPYKPIMWTDAWTGWFTQFGGTINHRPVQDMAFAVARFIQRGGSFLNYYMFHGGTNFGRTSGPFITTSYDYDAPIDEYGLLRQPKYGHLMELHRAIKMCERALVSSDPTVISLGSSQEAHVFSSGNGNCAAFLSNYNSSSAVRVMFNNMHYNLPPWSISILPDCKNVVFNSAKVASQTSRKQMLLTNTQLHSWENFGEDISSLEDSSTLAAVGLLEQLNLTRDNSDYLWYITSIDISPSESFFRGGQKPTLFVQSRGHAVHVFINGQLSGSAYGTPENMRVIFNEPVNLHAGTNRIALLSIAVGLPNNGIHFETWDIGILGPVVLQGLDQGHKDLSSQKWRYKVGLKGESMNLVSPNGVSSIEWMPGSLVTQDQQPLKWYKAYFDAPMGNEPLALDMKSMGKGEVWINGQSIGRYWITNANGNCGICKYSGTFRASKCQLGCGQPTQHWYHVPRSWLKPTQNLLVLFEELGGDASKISLVKTTTKSVCATAHEHHPTTENLHMDSNGESEMLHQTKVHLRCASGQTISAINFASFGTPSGTCGTFQPGTCHAVNSQSLIEQMCIGQESCRVAVSNTYFGSDPCPSQLKRLYVEAICSASDSRTTQSDFEG